MSAFLFKALFFLGGLLLGTLFLRWRRRSRTKQPPLDVRMSEALADVRKRRAEVDARMSAIQRGEHEPSPPRVTIIKETYE